LVPAWGRLMKNQRPKILCYCSFKLSEHLRLRLNCSSLTARLQALTLMSRKILCSELFSFSNTSKKFSNKQRNNSYYEVLLIQPKQFRSFSALFRPQQLRVTQPLYRSGFSKEETRAVQHKFVFSSEENGSPFSKTILIFFGFMLLLMNSYSR
jgi:hypothetical protein